MQQFESPSVVSEFWTCWKFRGDLMRPFNHIKQMRWIVQRKRQDVRIAKFTISKCFKAIGSQLWRPHYFWQSVLMPISIQQDNQQHNFVGETYLVEICHGSLQSRLGASPSSWKCRSCGRSRGSRGGRGRRRRHLQLVSETVEKKSDHTIIPFNKISFFRKLNSRQITFYWVVTGLHMNDFVGRSSIKKFDLNVVSWRKES